MGAVTRQKEIRQRRTRRAKRKRLKLRALKQALAKGRTHQERLRLAQEFRDKATAVG